MKQSNVRSIKDGSHVEQGGDEHLHAGLGEVLKPAVREKLEETSAELGDEAIIQELRQNLRQDVQDILHSAKEFVVELGHFALKTFDRLPLPGKRLVHSLVDRYLVRE